MELDEVLRRQAGVLTLSQARRCGLGAKALASRLAHGGWREVGPAVYLAGGHRWTDEARVRAAWLWANTDGPGRRGGVVVSGPAAAHWHGLLDRAPTRVELTAARAQHRRPPPGVHLRRRDLDVRDVTSRDGLTLTAVALTVLETSLIAGPAFLDRALQRHTTGAELRAAQHRRMGARGSRQIGLLLAAALSGGESGGERRLVALLRGAHVTGWVLGLPFGRWTIDLAFPALRLAVEVDGWAWHSDPARFAADRAKGNALVRAGWRLLRLTWADLHQRPEATLALIRSAIADCRPTPA